MRKLLNLVLLLSLQSFGQTAVDTIGVMHYNILAYRSSNGNCTNSNNNAASKEGYMNTIVSYLQPDIITCNEIAGDGGTAANRLLTNALNINGRTYYKQCTYNGNSNLCNMLYYNSNKFKLYKQDKIERAPNNTFLVRLIDVYTLYYTNSSSLRDGDTTFLVAYVAHLKAGSAASDRTQRESATEAVMAYHETNYKEYNYIMAGDFNIRSGSETSYENLIEYSNSSVRFHDPKNRKASWNSNSNYADLHTQSTRSSSSNGGCFSTGGLDDRFDFILCGKEILDNTRGINYIDKSYKAVGNDALHFNKNIISPGNTSVPANVLSALYDMSDHLPVYMELGITRGTAGTNELVNNPIEFIYSNPVSSMLKFRTSKPGKLRAEILNTHGQVVWQSDHLQKLNGWYNIKTEQIIKGTYILHVMNANGSSLARKKIIKI